MKTRSGNDYIGERQKKKKRRGKTDALSTQSKTIKKKKTIASQKSLKKGLMNSREVRQLEENDAANETPLPSSDKDELIVQRTRKTQKMGDYLNRIEKLKMDGNLAENWRRF